MPYPTTGYGPLPYAAQANRPGYFTGTLSFNGQQFPFGTGGAGRGSIPYGNYPITPGTIGPWGQANGAIGINNNAIQDTKIGATRQGIELHAGTNPKLITQGCIAIAGNQWQQFRSQVMQRINNGEKLTLNVGPNGASIDSSSGPLASANSVQVAQNFSNQPSTPQPATAAQDAQINPMVRGTQTNNYDPFSLGAKDISPYDSGAFNNPQPTQIAAGTTPQQTVPPVPSVPLSPTQVTNNAPNNLVPGQPIPQSVPNVGVLGAANPSPSPMDVAMGRVGGFAPGTPFPDPIATAMQANPTANFPSGPTAIASNTPWVNQDTGGAGPADGASAPANNTPNIGGLLGGIGGGNQLAGLVDALQNSQGSQPPPTPQMIRPQVNMQPLMAFLQQHPALGTPGAISGWHPGGAWTTV
jgi:hypothetical protein